jgi:hypothetical protein
MELNLMKNIFFKFHRGRLDFLIVVNSEQETLKLYSTPSGLLVKKFVFLIILNPFGVLIQNMIHITQLQNEFTSPEGIETQLPTNK